MLQKTILIVFGLAMVLLITAGKNNGNTILKSSGSHISSTGAPGEQTCAKSGCHIDAQIDQDDNKVVTKLILGDNEKIYTPAQKYTMKLHAIKAGVGRFGFQIVALDTNNRSSGAFSVPQNYNRVQLQNGTINGSNRNYVTHTTAGNKPDVVGEVEWNFVWTAPQSYKGKVTFYYCVNATNMDNTNTGDHLFVASESYTTSATKVSENEDFASTFRVYPTVANDYLTVENESGFAKDTKYEIVSSSGLSLQKNRIESSGNSVVIPLELLPNGYYIVRITTAGIAIVKNFVVLR